MKYHLSSDRFRCPGEVCDRRSKCLRFLADNKDAIVGQLSYSQPEPIGCQFFIGVTL